MRRRLLLMVALLFSTAGILRADAPAAGMGPRLSVDPPAFDFGAALPQKTLAKEFVLRNVGRGELVVADVATTCNCTVADQSYKRRLKPGESTRLRLELQTGTTPGRLLKTATIQSNDPVQPSLDIKLEVTVTPAPAR